MRDFAAVFNVHFAWQSIRDLHKQASEFFCKNEIGTKNFQELGADGRDVDRVTHDAARKKIDDLFRNGDGNVPAALRRWKPPDGES